MSELTQAIQGNHSFTYQGKEYQISPCNYNVQSDFERKMFARARGLAKMIREDDPKEYSKMMQKIQDDYMLGKYSLETPEGQALAQSPKGIISLVSLMCNVNEQEIIPMLTSENKEEIIGLVRLVLMESFGISEEQAKETLKRVEEDRVIK
jgi:hypothetical protein